MIRDAQTVDDRVELWRYMEARGLETWGQRLSRQISLVGRNAKRGHGVHRYRMRVPSEFVKVLDEKAKGVDAERVDLDHDPWTGETYVHLRAGRTRLAVGAGRNWAYLIKGPHAGRVELVRCRGRQGEYGLGVEPEDVWQRIEALKGRMSMPTRRELVTAVAKMTHQERMKFEPFFAARDYQIAPVSHVLAESLRELAE